MIVLAEECCFATGSTRACYTHSDWPDSCIKVELDPGETSRRRIRKEIQAHQRVISRGAKSTALSVFQGIEETTLGTGYLFELVRDTNGRLSPTLKSCRNDFTDDELRAMIGQFYRLCVQHNYVIGDLHGENLAVRDRQELVLIDGLGTVDWLPIFYASVILRRVKLNRKILRLCRLLNLSFDPARLPGDHIEAL